jgi:nucleotide-binding universal stress UspA family protein
MSAHPPSAPSIKRESARPILVPTDFSITTHAALRYAFPLARKRQAPLHFLHVVVPAEGDYYSPLRYTSDPAGRGVDEILRQRLETMLGAYREFGVRTESVCSRSYTVANKITRYARAEGVETIVMHTSGRGGIARFLTRSVAEEVARDACGAVVTVGGSVERTSPELQRILVPVDFSKESAAALREAVELGRREHATVDVLHVITSSRLVLPFLSSESQARTSEEREALETINAWTRAHTADYDLPGIHLRRGDPATVIGRVARTLSSDLIVLGRPRPTGPAHLLAGEIASEVVRNAPCPVLTVKWPASTPPKREAGGEKKKPVTAV